MFIMSSESFVSEYANNNHFIYIYDMIQNIILIKKIKSVYKNSEICPDASQSYQ